MSASQIAGAVIARMAEDDAEFDPTIVSPGVEGFIFTGLMAAAVIVLGLVLVRRLRRNAYRSEVREQIAEELAEREGGAGEPGSASGEGSAEAPGADK